MSTASEVPALAGMARSLFDKGRTPGEDPSESGSGLLHANTHLCCFRRLPTTILPLLLLLLCFSFAAAAPIAPIEARTALSRSGQFVVHAPAPTQKAFASHPPNTSSNLLRLEFNELAVSCERIKELLVRELGGGSSPWRGKIHLSLYPAHPGEESILLASELFRDGWQYRLDLPELLERERYVRAIVQVLLLELANRTSTGRSAEIPLWLLEGVTQHLLAESDIQILFQPAHTGAYGVGLSSTNYMGRRGNPIDHVRKLFRDRPPLSFEELSWPTDDPLSAENAARYRCSCQLFVSELLRLKNGPACLREMVAQLPEHYNWQLAFLRAFQAYFQRPLDVEKWWSLQRVQFTRHDPAQTWPLAESWRQLEAALNWHMEVRAVTNELPLHAPVTLQLTLLESDSARRVQALRSKLVELDLLRPRMSRELLPLLDAYRQAVANYLLSRSKPEPFRLFGASGNNERTLTTETTQRLDALDARLSALRPAQGPVLGDDR
jgi:hypothetical protein